MEKAIHFNFQTTNNVAEYEAFLAGLDLARELKIKNLVVNTDDSQLVANQVQGLYDVREQNFKGYKEATISAIIFFDLVKINLLKRDYIEEADVLAKLGAAKSSATEKWIQVSSLISSSVKENLEISIAENDWRDEVINFINGTEFKGDKFQERDIRNQAAHYIFLEKELYRRETDTFPLRTCVTKKEGEEIASIIHNGGGGAHRGGRRLFLQVSRQGYFWPSMKTDIHEIVKK